MSFTTNIFLTILLPLTFGIVWLFRKNILHQNIFILLISITFLLMNADSYYHAYSPCADEIRLITWICRVMFLSLRCLEQNGSDRRSASERQLNKGFRSECTTQGWLYPYVFFVLKKRGSVFMPSVSLLRAFFIAGILNLRKQSAVTLDYQMWKRRVT